MPEARVGLIPGSGGCSRLVKHVGLGRAKELVMLGASLSAQRAYEIGLATSVNPSGTALDSAIEFADRLAELAPMAVGMAKLVLNNCIDTDRETGRHLERIGQSVLRLSEDHQEGVAAFLEKRPPEWRSR
jgi:enoyl-CoA hydratase